MTAKKRLPKMVYAEASVKSLGGIPLFEAKELIQSKNVQNFQSDPELVKAALTKLEKEGFQILNVGETTISIAAPPETYERVFKTKITSSEKPVVKEMGREDTAEFLDSPDTSIQGLIDTSKSSLADVLEGVALNEPAYYFATAFPPPIKYWHLDVPADVSLALKADRSHRLGYTGKGVRVAMVDSGWYRHPFFTSRGYHANPVVLGPATANPLHDEHGHGTGESANIFAIAPDVNFTMVKMNSVNTVGAFNKAVALNPDIITCSWGYDILNGPLSANAQALAAAISLAINKGIIVIFSAGNGHFGFPGQHPEVISAGGTYKHMNGNIEATPYASGFLSQIYANRRVPDISGLVGLPPGAQYLMLPVEPGCEIDNLLAGGHHPNGDETLANDGWAAFSGTSAAAPQIAGVCALMKQACARLTPKIAKQILMKTATDVTAGNCSPRTGGHTAIAGHDLATGFGLVNAFQATVLATFENILRPPLAIPRPSIAVRPPITLPPVATPPRPPLPREITPEFEYVEDENDEDLIKIENMILGTN